MTGVQTCALPIYLLKKLYPNALVLSKSDAQNFASNSPTIDKAIIIDERVSSDLQNELKRRGIKVISIDLSEFFKGGGGGKCLICELDSDLFRFEKCYNNKFQMLGSTINIFDAVYVNDPYMLNCIGTINKGLAQKQHENLMNILKKEGCEIYLMDTKKFQEPFDFETLRKAAYKICINNLYLDKFEKREGRDPLNLKSGFEKYVIRKEGCWDWKGHFYSQMGYGRFQANKKMKIAHRASWEIYYGEIPKGICVLHKCDNPRCTNPKHLFLGTIQDNNADMIKKNRNSMLCKPGSKNINAKFNNEQINEIRGRSEEHTSELQSHSFSSYAVFCLKKKKKKKHNT